MVDEETDDRVDRSVQRLEQAGVTLQQALDAEGFDELRFRSDTRAHATRALKADLILEAVARQEGIEVTAEDLEREIAATARQLGREPKEVAKVLERSGQIATLAGDIIRSKALDFLVESADVTSEDSSPASGDDGQQQEEAEEPMAAPEPTQSQGDQE
jgi:trigger factor